MVLEPLEKPDDPYGLNEQRPDGFQIMLVSVPIVGFGGVLGAWQHYNRDKDTNPFNLAETSRQAFLLGVVLQTLYLIVGIPLLVIL